MIESAMKASASVKPWSINPRESLARDRSQCTARRRSMPAKEVNTQLRPTTTKPPLSSIDRYQKFPKFAPLPLHSSQSLRARTFSSLSLSILLPSSHLGDPYLHLHLGLPKTTHPLAPAPVKPMKSTQTSYRLGYETTSARDRHLSQAPSPFPFCVALIHLGARDSAVSQMSRMFAKPTPQRLTILRRISHPKPSELQRRKSHDPKSFRWVYACNRPAASVRFCRTQ